MKPIIAIDKDDTLNWLTWEICKKAGINRVEDVPHLDQIKAKQTTNEFQKARIDCFSDPAFFASEPYGHAHDIVDMASEYGFEPVICTKTMTKHPKYAEITAHKMDFWQKHFSHIDMHIVTGKKSIDAIALIDDSVSNCFSFNKKSFRPFLVWDHKTGSIELLNAFYRYCKFYMQHPTVVGQMVTKNITVDVYTDKLIVNKNPEKIDSDKFEAIVELIDDTGIPVNIFIKNHKETSAPDSAILATDFLNSMITEQPEKENIKYDFWFVFLNNIKVI